MSKAASWKSNYKARPDGRFRITGAALKSLGADHPERILETELWAKPARVLLLDKPFKLGTRVPDPKVDEYLMRRIRLHELPGWPPKMASSANVQSLPALMDCSLRQARFSEGHGPGQEGVELILAFEKKTYRAWFVACPIPLLKCVEATLGQKIAVGKMMGDLQDITLIGSGD